MFTLPRAAMLIALIALSACSTLETAADNTRDFAVAHPVVTGVGAGLVAGGIAIAIDHHHDRADPTYMLCERGVTVCGSAP